MFDEEGIYLNIFGFCPSKLDIGRAAIDYQLRRSHGLPNISKHIKTYQTITTHSSLLLVSYGISSSLSSPSVHTTADIVHMPSQVRGSAPHGCRDTTNIQISFYYGFRFTTSEEEQFRRHRGAARPRFHTHVYTHGSRHWPH